MRIGTALLFRTHSAPVLSVVAQLVSLSLSLSLCLSLRLSCPVLFRETITLPLNWTTCDEGRGELAPHPLLLHPCIHLTPVSRFDFDLSEL